MKRGIFLGFAAIATSVLVGCTSMSTYRGDPTKQFVRDYRAITDEGYKIPSVPLSKLDSKYYRQIVDYETKLRPGTIVVDVAERFLYLVEPNGKAVRYGIGVGRQGFAWSGVASIGWKAEWPTWTPPPQMIKRQPSLKKYASGMEPGLDNPLGARALYLMKNGKDTLYRLHGTPDWSSIGKAVSSGCIRLINQDIIDLYERVRPGARVVVRQG